MDGGAPRPIAGFEPGESPVGWSRDGQSLFLERFQESTIEIHRLNTLTGRREPTFRLGPPDPAGIVGYTAVAVSPDGKSYAYSFMRNLSELYLIDGLR
jgi:hypothetical protein